MNSSTMKKNNTQLKKCVYQFYIDKINKSDSILDHEAFELLKLVDQNITEIHSTKWVNLLVGSTQSGKTFYMLALANIYLSIGYLALFIVKDLFQKTQFLNRYKADSKELRTYLKKEGFSNEDLNMFKEPLYRDSKLSTVDKKKFNINLKDSLNGTRKRHILCIWNATHLQRVNDNIKVNSKFIMFTDEAQKLGCYKKISPDYQLTGNEYCAYDNIYSQIRVSASKLFLLTATPQPILVAEPDLYTSGIVIIPEKNDYRGDETWKFSLIPSEIDEIYLSTITGITVLKNDKESKVPVSFLSLLAKLSDKNPIKRINKFNNKDLHPINILTKFEITNEGQKNILDLFKPDSFIINKDHQKIVNRQWGCFLMNQEGIRFYHESLKYSTFKSAKKINDCEYLFPNSISIGQLWHWCWKNGGVHRFGHIITIAYKSAEEGLTFSSTWNNSPSKDANWHLTHIYSRNGSKIASYSLEQFFGRINGNHGDKMKAPRVYCSISEKEKHIKSFNLHRKQIRELCTLSVNHKNELVSKHIHEYKIFDNQVPNEYYGGIKNAKQTLKITHNPFSDIEKKAFLQESYTKNILSIINENENKNFEELKVVVDRVDNRKEKIDKITEILKNKKKNKNYILLSSLDINKTYSKKDIENIAKLAKYKNPLSMFHSLTKNSTYGFGCIFDKNGSNWKIKEELKGAWKN